MNRAVSEPGLTGFLRSEYIIFAFFVVSTLFKKTNVTAGKRIRLPAEKQLPHLVYNANVTTESDTTGKSYIGLTEGTLKQRSTQHKLSFRNRNYSYSTIKTYLKIQRQYIQFYNKLEYFSDNPAYKNNSKRCHLCVTEKTFLN